MTATSLDRADRVTGAVVVAVSALLGFRPLTDDDVFFHLFLGRAVLAAGSRTVPEPAAFADFSDPCVVPEWLWAVLTYGVQSAFGFSGLVALGVLGAIGCALALLHLARTYAGPSKVTMIAVGGIAMLVAQSRMTVRPELAALVWIPIHLALAKTFSEREGRARLAPGIGLVVGAFVWAQVHGSIVLAPVTFAIQMLPLPTRDAERASSDRERLQAAGLVFVGLLLATCSTAYGLGIASFIVSHGFSGAAAHVAEMRPMTWAMFHPGESPSVLGYLVLLALGGAGMLIARSLRVRELLLVALGMALVYRGQRFVTEAAILAVPLAALGTVDVLRHVSLEADALATHARVGASAVLVVLAAWTFHETGTRYSFMDGGLAPGAFPILEARFLAGTPEGANVYTDYTGSAALGFVSNGRYRVYVDGRTPLYFDQVDFGMLRDQMLQPDALRRGLARYGAVAAVVRRERPACATLAEHWEVAFVGPRYTVFRPGTPGRSHSALAACGRRLLLPAMCAEDRLVESTASTIERLGDPAFANLVRAAYVLECGNSPDAALESIASFEPRSAALSDAYRRLHTRALLAAGHDDEAEASIREGIEALDFPIIQLLQEPAAERFPIDRSEALLREYTQILDDETEPAIRAVLASLCMREGDEDCVREQAMRAAVRGLPTPALDWLVEHHSSERVRNDAARWRETLAADRAAAPAAP